MTHYLRVREVADQLRVDPRTVYRMIERGELRAVRTGRSWRVEADSLESGNGSGGVEPKGATVQGRVGEEVLGAMSESVLVIDTATAAIVWSNPAAEELFGYPPGGLVGLPIATINAPSERTPEETAATIIAALRADGVWRGEVENVRRDGRRIWTVANVTTYDDPDLGTVWVSVQSDITEHRHIRGELVDAVAGEEQAMARLHEAIRARRELLRLASHDLRNPLAATKGFLQLVERLPDDAHERRAEMLQRLSSLADDLTVRFEHLLDLASGELDGGPPRARRFDVAHVLDSVARRAGEHAEVAWEVDDDLALTADREMFGQVIGHLVDNAVSRAPSGPVRLQARACDGGVRVEVTDVGPRIDVQAADDVLDPHRIASESVEVPSALALAIARRGVERHGGRLWVESSPESTTFKAHFPA